MASRHFAVIPAAGTGSRSGAPAPKQYSLVAGEPMLAHAVRAFLRCDAIVRVLIVHAAADPWPQSPAGRALAREGEGRLEYAGIGGATRAQSVSNGLDALCAFADVDDWVLVHDAARPCITPQLLEALIAALAGDPVGGLLAVPVVDTVKRVDAAGRVAATLSRDGLWLAQTPQMFRLGLLRRAYAGAGAATDEAAAVEALGLAPRVVAGHVRNIKVTHPQDFALAERYLIEEQRPAGEK